MKAAIIGAGFIADFHASAYVAQPGVELCAVADVDEARAGALAQSYGARGYADASAMLGAERPDLVSVCVPTFLHTPMVLAALERNAHVLVEKPFALTMEECEAMEKAARAAGRLLMVGQVLRFWPEYRALAGFYRTERLGPLRAIRAARLQHSARGGWFELPEKSGGALFDLHLHDVDFVTSLLGFDIERLWAVGTRSPQGAWRRVSTALAYREGPEAQIEASNWMPQGYPFTAYCRLDGAGATAEYRFRAPVNIEKDAPSDTLFTVYGPDGGQPAVDYGGMGAQERAFHDEIGAFVAAARDGKPSPLPVAESLRVMRLIHLIGESLETGRPVENVGARIEAP